MSKQYQIKLDLDSSKLTPNGGFLMVQCDKEVDARGFRERKGPEIFVFIAQAAITGANPRCGYDAMKGFTSISDALVVAQETGEYTANKTDLDVIKNSIKGNQNWPNNPEVAGILGQMMEKLENAVEIT